MTKTKMIEVEVEVRDAFNLSDVPQGVTVPGYAEPGPFTPEPEPGYRFRKEALSDVLAWFKVGGSDGLFLAGPTGSGKTSLLVETASRLNWPVQRATGHARLEFQELVGHHTVIDGDMVFVDGPLTAAMRHGHLFLLDEIDLVDPGELAGLNGIVEGAPLSIPENGGEVVKPAPGFRFAATGNTAGGGDTTGLYQGAVRQNLAFMDRFWVIGVGYPDPEDEKAILAEAVPDLPEETRKEMVNVAGEVRRLFMGGDDAEGEAALEVTLSTRGLVRWAHLTLFNKGIAARGISPLHHALDRALAFRAEPETRQALHDIVQRVFGEGWEVANDG